MLSCRGSGRARDNATGCECPRRNGTQLQGGWRGVSSNMLWSQSSRSTCISTGLSRVGLGLRRLEEGVGQLAKPHGHGLRHVGRLGVHDGIEERLQVGLRVPADVHDLVAGRGCGRGRGGPGRRHGRRRGALRGRLGRRLLRGLHGCGLVRRSGHCAQVRGAATRARIALHSLPEAASPLLPSPPRAPSFLPFFAPGRGGVPTETETLAPDAQTKKLRGAPARAPRGLRLLDALPSSARPPAPNPQPAAPGETFPARRYIPADSRPHVTRGRPRCVRTHRPAPSRSAAGADPAGPARNAKAARNRDNRLEVQKMVLDSMELEYNWL